MPCNPEGTLVRGRFRSSGFSHPDDALDQHLMPNFVEAALPAGSGIAFDVSAAAPFESSDLKETAAQSHIWHTSIQNTSESPRRCCYYTYKSSETYGADGRSPKCEHAVVSRSAD